MEKVLYVWLLIFSLVALTGCGGGGGGGSDTDPNQVFKLNEAITIPGQNMSFSLKGTDTNGGKYEGSFIISTKQESVFEGQPITPVEVFLSLTNTERNVFISNIQTTFFDANQKPVVKFSGNDPVITYMPTNISVLPDKAKIGDFGFLTSWVTDKGQTISGTWVLESNSDDLADLVMMTTIKNNLGIVQFYEEDTLTIDEDGYAQSTAMKLYIPQDGNTSEATINLSGKRTN